MKFLNQINGFSIRMNISAQSTGVGEEPEQILLIRQIRLAFIALFPRSAHNVMLLVRRRRRRRRFPLLHLNLLHDDAARLLRRLRRRRVVQEHERVFSVAVAPQLHVSEPPQLRESRRVALHRRFRIPLAVCSFRRRRRLRRRRRNIRVFDEDLYRQPETVAAVVIVGEQKILVENRKNRTNMAVVERVFGGDRRSIGIRENEAKLFLFFYLIFVMLLFVFVFVDFELSHEIVFELSSELVGRIPRRQR